MPCHFPMICAVPTFFPTSLQAYFPFFFTRTTDGSELVTLYFREVFRIFSVVDLPTLRALNDFPNLESST